MRAGLSTLIFPWWTLEQAVKTCLELGSEHVEIICDFPYFVPGRPKPDLRQVRSLLREWGASTSVHASFWDLNPGSHLPELRRLSIKRLKLGIRTCARLGGDLTVMHAGRCPIPEVEWLWEGTRKFYEQAVEECLKLAKRLGVRIAIENGSSGFGPYAKLGELKEFVDRWDGRLGACFDVGHAHLEGRRSGLKSSTRFIEKWIEDMGDRIIHMHLHDNRGLRDDHMIPGEGEIDFGALARAVRRNGYGGDLVVELFEPRKPLKAGKQGLRRVREFFGLGRIWGKTE